jgi:hypothetical protein
VIFFSYADVGAAVDTKIVFILCCCCAYPIWDAYPMDVPHAMHVHPFSAAELATTPCECPS